MKKLTLLLATAFTLVACGGEPSQPTQSASKAQTEKVEQPTPIQEVATIKTIPLNYADYQVAVNKGLAAQKTGLTLPKNVVPTDDDEGKNLLHDFSDGLTLSLKTNKADKITEIRVIWDSDIAPNKAEKLSKAVAALIAATAPEDHTLLSDTEYQIKSAISSHNEQRDPTREWVRGGIAYKATVTNLPSVVLTAKPE